MRFFLTEQQLIIDGFQDQPKFKCFIAEIKKEVVGIALIYLDILLGKSCYAFRRFDCN